VVAGASVMKLPQRKSFVVNYVPCKKNGSIYRKRTGRQLSRLCKSS